MALIGIIAITTVATAQAIDPEFLLDTEGRAGKAAVIGFRIAHPTGAADTEGVETIALVIIQAGHTLDAPIGGIGAEGGRGIAAGVIGQITEDTGIAHALAGPGVATLGILGTGDALIAVTTLYADR